FSGLASIRFRARVAMTSSCGGCGGDCGSAPAQGPTMPSQIVAPESARWTNVTAVWGSLRSPAKPARRQGPKARPRDSHARRGGPSWIRTRWEGEKEEGFQLVAQADRARRQVGDKLPDSSSV